MVLWSRGRPESGLHRLSVLWDAPLYQSIARLGYAGVAPIPGPHGDYEMYAFFPLYPTVTRWTAWLLPLSISQAALLVAWAGSLAAAWGIYAVAAKLYNRRTGVMAAVLWGVLPHAAVQSMAYSEPVFTAFAAWAVYQAICRRWLTAGLLAVLAGLTRPTGLAVAGAIGAAALWELCTWRRRSVEQRASAWWRPLVAMVIAPAGAVGYIGWVGLQKGRWDAYFKIQEAWQSEFDFGRATFRSFQGLLTNSGQVWLADVMVAVVLFAAVILFGVSLIQRQPLPLVLLSAGILVLAFGDAAYFNCRARFLLPAFGLLLPLAVGLARLRSRATVALILAGAAVVSAFYGAYIVLVYPNAP
ncbi:hypothetical protein [Kitasatospora sp. NPDC088134]|uniref:hypothetical protein n=1 Tax=Kitasatospora sp. NPDC088134 TaxID=3364071 RepID=UPI003812793A